jgi:hypothetical protein
VAQQKAAEEAARQKAAEEEAAQQKAAEEEAMRQAAEEAARQRAKAEMEEREQKLAAAREAEERQREAAELSARRKQQREEDAARKQQEAEAAAAEARAARARLDAALAEEDDGDIFSNLLRTLVVTAAGTLRNLAGDEMLSPSQMKTYDDLLSPSPSTRALSPAAPSTNVLDQYAATRPSYPKADNRYFPAFPNYKFGPVESAAPSPLVSDEMVDQTIKYNAPVKMLSKEQLAVPQLWEPHARSDDLAPVASARSGASQSPHRYQANENESTMPLVLQPVQPITSNPASTRQLYPSLAAAKEDVPSVFVPPPATSSARRPSYRSLQAGETPPLVDPDLISKLCYLLRSPRTPPSDFEYVDYMPSEDWRTQVVPHENAALKAYPQSERNILPSQQLEDIPQSGTPQKNMPVPSRMSEYSAPPHSLPPQKDTAPASSAAEEDRALHHLPPPKRTSPSFAAQSEGSSAAWSAPMQPSSQANLAADPTVKQAERNSSHGIPNLPLADIPSSISYNRQASKELGLAFTSALDMLTHALTDWSPPSSSGKTEKRAQQEDDEFPDEEEHRRRVQQEAAAAAAEEEEEEERRRKVEESRKLQRKAEDELRQKEEEAKQRRKAEEKAAEEHECLRLQQRAAEEKAVEQKAAEEEAALQRKAEEQAAQQKAVIEEASQQKAAEEEAAMQKIAEERAAAEQKENEAPPQQNDVTTDDSIAKALLEELKRGGERRRPTDEELDQMVARIKELRNLTDEQGVAVKNMLLDIANSLFGSSSTMRVPESAGAEQARSKKAFATRVAEGIVHKPSNAEIQQMAATVASRHGGGQAEGAQTMLVKMTEALFGNASMQMSVQRPTPRTLQTIAKR